ncbi:MAG: alpha/beta hydrolase, partial [Pseudomonadota bacterium]
MDSPSFFDTPDGRQIAYHQTEGSSPGVVFLGGFASDMTGTKAIHLEEWAKARGCGYLRFDYSGHGQSSGAFEDGAIGDWAADARAVIAAKTNGPQILVGSSRSASDGDKACDTVRHRLCHQKRDPAAHGGA